MSDKNAVPSSAENQQPTESSTGRSFFVQVDGPRNVDTTDAGPDQASGDEEPVPEHQDPLSIMANAEDKKRKKKKKSKGKKKSAQPTGFEENYADAPMTPAEHNEERNDLYNKSRSFAERIETCIQRYRARRKFDNDRKDVFDKYLALGGIDTGPKMFSGGLDREYLENLNAGEIATATAIDAVGRDKYGVGRDASTWTVDFEGVAKCFFSSRAPTCFDLSNGDRVLYCVNIVRNFLNYVLHHDVCPDYVDQVRAARAVCNQAETELALVRDASVALPGDFNVAVSTLFGGHYTGVFGGADEWAAEMDISVGMSDEKAAKVIETALKAYGTDGEAELFNGRKNMRISTTFERPIEVTEMVFSDEKVKQLYANENANRTDKEALKPLGQLYARTWEKPFAREEDHSDDEGDSPSGTGKVEETRLELWIEDDLLRTCFVGMKMDALIRELTISRGSGSDAEVVRVIPCLDAVYSVFCSFYTALANEMMIGWRKPVPVGVDGDGQAEDGAADKVDGEDNFDKD